MQLPISLVVSLGSGANPVKDQTNVEITTEIWNAPSRFFSFMGIIGQAVSVQQKGRLVLAEPGMNEESVCSLH